MGILSDVFCKETTIVTHDIAVTVTRQSFQALKYLHKMSMIYMNIRMDNLLFYSATSWHQAETGYEFFSFDEASVSLNMSLC